MKQAPLSMHILLVDDDETDRELFKEAAATSIPGVTVSEAINGKEAIRVLNESEQLPDLILLDLNMPVMDGRETLKMLKKDPHLKAVPVCILTTSNASFDIRQAYEEGANLFQVKPLTFSHFQQILQNLDRVFRGNARYKKPSQE